MTDTAAEPVIPIITRQSITPSGIGLKFSPEPRQYWVNDIPVESVTKILDVLAKEPLYNWYWRGGIEGVLRLIHMGDIGRLNGEPVLVTDMDDYVPATEPAVMSLLKTRSLTPKDVMEKKGDIGTTVHKAMEMWVDTGIVPDPDFYGEDERGYIVGLVAFLNDVKIDLSHHIESEVMVGSVKHKFAGTFDIRCQINECSLRRTPVRDNYSDFSAGRWMFDLKTSRYIYDTHFIQLEAYEGASVECGYQPTVGRAVVHITPAGSYQVRVSKARYSDFTKIKGAYDAVKRVKGAK